MPRQSFPRWRSAGPVNEGIEMVDIAEAMPFGAGMLRRGRSRRRPIRFDALREGWAGLTITGRIALLCVLAVVAIAATAAVLLLGEARMHREAERVAALSELAA